MITIRLTTWVNAPVERCFLLAASRELISAMGAQPEAGSGRGVLQPNDVLRWQLAVGGARLSYTSRIEQIRPYSFFKETMVSGMFRQFEHEHHFARMDDGTRVRDEIRFDLRYGPLGRFLGPTVLRSALMKMLGERTRRVKQIAESGEWQRYLDATSELTPKVEQGASSRSVHQFAQG
jgi:ligand-binding SRPBCC domain-containing protein